MGTTNQKGFTIIETILFLAISGGLVAALLVGVNTNINQERYKDSVNSFANILQQQYELTTNVSSQRSNEWTCGARLQDVATADTLKGTTDCTIIGRVVQLSNGTEVTTSNIIAYDINEDALKTATSDIQGMTAAMSLTTMREVQASSDEPAVEIDWGSRVSTLDQSGNRVGNGNAFTVAIVRSPVTGRVMTFVANEKTSDWRNKVITIDSLRRSLVACVEPSLFISTPKTEVVIQAGGATTAAVSKVSGATGC